ncbi:MAG: long-chain fatty acid--CoA ligase [Gammaproteobacteria bacterium]|nr:long-chain fatty acid--CoA ligase [Gammaproteobacteria bacterium]
MNHADIIEPTEDLTLAGLFRERVERSPGAVAYKHYDWGRQHWVDTTWLEMSHEVGRWQQAMLKMGLQKGDRVALMLRNSREWVLFDQAALGLGLITVPLFVDDRPGNAAHILQESGAKLVIVAGKLQWRGLLAHEDGLPTVEQIVSVALISEEDAPEDSRLESLSDWLFGLEGGLQTEVIDPDATATLVFTSGTTGSSKGVMLSHRNILLNVRNGLHAVKLTQHELFLSFLPLSHMFERTAGYYLPVMCGYTVAFARSFQQLGDDLKQIRPTCFISVPRIYEKLYTKIQNNLNKASLYKRVIFRLTLVVGYRRMCFLWGQKWWSPIILLWPLLNKLVAGKILQQFGGRIRIALCGGAALSREIDQFFNSLGLTLLQGYGLTEASPVISVNNPKYNKLGSVGPPLKNTLVRIAGDGELQTLSASVMSGYWKNEKATVTAFTEDGWLRTGDLAYLDEDGFIYLTGRLKEILILSNGENIPPGDMETAISLDALFEQVAVVGDGRPSLAALVVLNKDAWHEFALERGINIDEENVLNRKDVKKAVLSHMAGHLKKFPGYAQIREVYLTLEPWTIEQDLLTPTMKLKRSRLLEFYKNQIEELFTH